MGIAYKRLSVLFALVTLLAQKLLIRMRSFNTMPLQKTG